MEQSWQIDVEAALDAIVSAIKAQFPEFRSVIAEDEPSDALTVPAVLVQLSEIEPEPDSDAMTGQLACVFRIEARIVMGALSPSARIAAATAAGRLAAFVHQNRLGSMWDGAIVLAVEPDEFAPGADQFVIWRVEWAHAGRLGDSNVPAGDDTPVQILVSHAPLIGPGNEEYYS
jgi:hypothetical protein